MLAALREITQGKGSELFLFATDEAIAKGNALQAEWITGKGNIVRLCD